MKIIKSFNGKKPEEIDSGGLFASVSYETLLPYLQKIIPMHSGEKIIGLIISEAGIRIKIEKS